MPVAFALFGWSKTAHPLFGDYTRYMLALGGLGAVISGSLMLKESLIKEKSSAQLVNEPNLEFLVLVEKEQEQSG